MSEGVLLSLSIISTLSKLAQQAHANQQLTEEQVLDALADAVSTSNASLDRLKAAVERRRIAEDGE